jgi:hypothetical protein
MDEQTYAIKVDSISDAGRDVNWYHLQTPSCEVDKNVDQLVRWDHQRGLWQTIFMVSDEDGNTIDELCEAFFILPDGRRFSDTILT